MNTFVRLIAVIVTAFALLTAVGGLSPANADQLTGKTYKEAAATVSGWGATPVIETVVGSVLANDDCIVSSWQKSSFRDSSGAQRKSEVLMNLNCNDPVASAGRPGNSAASAEGRAAKATLEQNVKTAEWCALSDQAGNKDCANFCAEVGATACAATFEKNRKTANWCALPEQATYEPCADFCSKHEGLCTSL